MSLDPTIMQGLLVALGAVVLLGPSALALLKKVRLPSLPKRTPAQKSDVDAFVSLALVRDYLGEWAGDEENKALEVLAVAIVMKGEDE